MKKLITFLLVLLPFLISCSRVYRPVWPYDKNIKAPMEIENGGKINSNRTLTLVNGWAAPQFLRVYTSPLGNARNYVEFQAWTNLVIERLEAELKKRGVKISPSGDKVFKVFFTHATYTEAPPFKRSYADTSIRIEASDGNWVKTYKATGYGIGVNVRLDLALYNTVEAIIKDSEFREAISGEYEEKATKNNIIQKLEQLKEMKEKGLITEEEYQNKRKEVLKMF